MLDVVVVGSFVQDLAFSTPRFPAPGETRIGQFQTGAGGKGFNQAVAARRQGAPALFIGAIGKDMFGQQLRSFADHERLRCALEVIDAAPSGAASILVNDQGQNLIVVALGANAHLSVKHIDRFAADIGTAKVLVCQFENNLPATERALRIARQAGVLTILNPAPINTAAHAELLHNVDILVPNETEFAHLCQSFAQITLPEQFWNRSDAQMHEYCRALNVPTVIVTLGALGCFVSHADDTPRHPTSLPYYRVAAADVTPLDTTGAGDAFCGALATGLARVGPGKMNLACQFATRVAGLSTEHRGTAQAMPDAAAVIKRFGAAI